MVNISLRVLSRPDALFIPVIARELGQDFDEKGMVSSIALRGKGKVVRVWVFLRPKLLPFSS